MFELVKNALRISTDAFDDEIQLFIDDCLAELENLGVIKAEEPAEDTETDETEDVETQGTDAAEEEEEEELDPQIVSAVISYCKWHFGENADAAKWEDIYNTKVHRLIHTTGYGR